MACFNQLMCRFALLAIFAATTVVGLADSPPELISLGPIKAVMFPNSLSADGRFVLAWTLLPKDKHRPSFDWSGWSPDAPRAPLDKFSWGIPDSKMALYSLHNIFVDLARKRWADLPTDLPSFTGKGFGPPTLLCEPSPHGAMHAVVQNPGHFGSLDLWLVTVGKTISVRDESRAVNDAVNKLLLAKYGKLNGGETWFAIDSQGNPEGIFSSKMVNIDFDSGTESESTLTGTLTIRFADGKIVNSKD
jgi:hypothetical protein